jgi:hypothetical protein
VCRQNNSNVTAVPVERRAGLRNALPATVLYTYTYTAINRRLGLGLVIIIALWAANRATITDVVVWGGGNKGRNEDTPGLGFAVLAKKQHWSDLQFVICLTSRGTLYTTLP